ncbi:hypothetical protein KY363_03750 [Candidatus Woesearchaeota archaeon]|nr:hypothetical protein [Candidatus Woesearchaeota archaeon]
MYSWRNFVDKWKRYAPLETFEKRGLIITVAVLAFIFSFREWGTETFDVTVGTTNLLISIVLVAIAMLVHEATHRVIALWLGYRTQFKAWITGLVIGLVVAFVSNGTLVFLAPGQLVFTHLPIHRLGKGYYELTYKHLGWVAMSGSIANMLFAVLLKIVYVATGIGVVQKLMMINIWIAIFDMLPIPPYNGSRTFFGSRYVYVFILGTLIGIAALLYYLSGIVPILGGIVLGALMLLVFFRFIDKRW